MNEPNNMPEDGRSKTCVVVVMTAENETRCGAPVVGERAGWPMCDEHMRVFTPTAHSDERDAGA